MNEEQVKEFFNVKYAELKSRIESDYVLKFNNNISRAGVCKYHTHSLTGIIEISRVYINSPKVTEAMVKNTVLHELAHAIAGHAAGHGPVWKSVAKSIGCDGERCVENFRSIESYKYILKCKHGCLDPRTRLARYMKKSKFKCRRHNSVVTVFERLGKGKEAKYKKL